MTEIIREWMLGLTAAALISSIAAALTPPGKMRGIVGLVSGLIMIVALIKPFISFDFNSLAGHIIEYKNVSAVYSANLSEETDRIVKGIIEEDTATYILDKAASFGIGSCQVVVKTKKDGEDYPYPYKIEINAEVNEKQKRELSDCIESEIGVPKERQYWSLPDGY